MFEHERILQWSRPVKDLAEVFWNRMNWLKIVSNDSQSVLLVDFTTGFLLGSP